MGCNFTCCLACVIVGGLFGLLFGLTCLLVWMFVVDLLLRLVVLLMVVLRWALCLHVLFTVSLRVAYMFVVFSFHVWLGLLVCFVFVVFCCAWLSMLVPCCFRLCWFGYFELVVLCLLDLLFILRFSCFSVSGLLVVCGL